MMRRVFKPIFVLVRPWFLLLQHLFHSLLLFFPLQAHQLILPNGRETIPDVSTIRSLFLFAASAKNKGHSIEACYTRQRILKNTAALTQSELSTMESPSQPSQEANTTPSLSLADLQDMVNQVHIPSSSASNTALSTVSGNSSTWLLDSACCNHMSSSPDVIPSHTPSSLPTIYTANGSSMHVSHQGTISTPNLSVSNVYHIPQLTHNLLSVGQLTELGFSLTFSSNGVVV